MTAKAHMMEVAMSKPEVVGVDLATEPSKTMLTLDVSGLGPHEIADIKSHVAGRMETKETYTAPRNGWTCFHCGETFLTPEGARLHFGTKPDAKPGCMLKVDDEEKGLLSKYRELEDNHRVVRNNAVDLLARATKAETELARQKQGYKSKYTGFGKGEPGCDDCCDGYCTMNCSPRTANKRPRGDHDV